jgi:UDP-GlcNAc:undecaprenyl-phosphate GlcNAc-1-phosphate transferase
LHDEQVRLHGKHKWEHLWETLTQFAEKHELAGVELMVNMPSTGEAYHATWRTRTQVEQHDAWRSDIPLVIEGIRAGHVRLVGVAPPDSVCDWMNRVMDGMRPFENQLREIVLHLRNQRMNPNGTLRDSGGPFRLPPVPEEATA